VWGSGGKVHSVTCRIEDGNYDDDGDDDAIYERKQVKLNGKEGKLRRIRQSLNVGMDKEKRK